SARLEFARQQGKISLSLRNPLDSTIDAENEPIITAEDLKIDFGNGRGIRGRKGKGPIPNVKNDEVWKRLTSGEPVVMGADGSIVAAPKPQPVLPKEPPKQKLVVDVYRGDKH